MSDQSALPPEALRKPLLRLLRPLVRLCIQSGITFPVLSDMLRELFVNVVEHDFALPVKQQTDSRVSLLTGINRKEVHRLRGQGAPLSEAPKALTRTSRILARWLAAPPFAGPDGKPLPLPRSAAGDAPSFDSLVATVTRDIRPRAVLDDWVDRELVEIGPDDIVRLRVEAMVPRAGDEQQLYYFGRNLHDHVAAAASNVMGRAQPFFERAVHYDGLSAAVAQQLEGRAREIANEAIQTANRDAFAACETDGGGRHRWNFGIYIYAVNEAEEPSAAPASAVTPSGDEA